MPNSKAPRRKKTHSVYDSRNQRPKWSDLNNLKSIAESSIVDIAKSALRVNEQFKSHRPALSDNSAARLESMLITLGKDIVELRTNINEIGKRVNGRTGTIKTDKELLESYDIANDYSEVVEKINRLIHPLMADIDTILDEIQPEENLPKTENEEKS